MTTHAWGGEIGRQDRAGVGAQRAHRTRGDSVSRSDGVWRIGDLGGFKDIPGDIAHRLRAFSHSRSGETGNDAPNGAGWTAPEPTVLLDRGEWADQKWHVVTLPVSAGLRG